MTPHRFDIQHRSNGTYVVRCGDLTSDNERTLARRLVEGDAPDGPIEGGREGRSDWTFPSLHRFAAGAVGRWEEGLHPALQAAVVTLRAEFAQRRAARGRGA